VGVRGIKNVEARSLTGKKAQREKGGGGNETRQHRALKGEREGEEGETRFSHRGKKFHRQKRCSLQEHGEKNTKPTNVPTARSAACPSKKGKLPRKSLRERLRRGRMGVWGKKGGVWYEKGKKCRRTGGPTGNRAKSVSS